jgi:hypothetical protein
MSCLVLGDSIAEMVGVFLKTCTVVAKVSMSSGWILAHAPSGTYDYVVISSSTNDFQSPKVQENLEATRRKTHATRGYVWIVPNPKRASRLVQSVAHDHRDRAVGFVPARDGEHPRYPKAVARAISGMMR